HIGAELETLQRLPRRVVDRRAASSQQRHLVTRSIGPVLGWDPFSTGGVLGPAGPAAAGGSAGLQPETCSFPCQFGRPPPTGRKRQQEYRTAHPLDRLGS